MTETEKIGVPFTPTILRGFVEDVREGVGYVYIKMTGVDQVFWLREGMPAIRVGNEVVLEADGQTIIGVWLRLV